MDTWNIKANLKQAIFHASILLTFLRVCFGDLRINKQEQIVMLTLF
jgi:hypothetical protein